MCFCVQIAALFTTGSRCRPRQPPVSIPGELLPSRTQHSRDPMPFDLPFDYVLVMAIWLAALAGSLPLLLVARRRLRTRRSDGRSGSRVPRRVVWADLALSLWIFLAALTAVELYFAVVYDASDAVNLTNVSKHWFKRHVEPDQKVLAFGDGHQTVYRDEL